MVKYDEALSVLEPSDIYDWSEIACFHALSKVGATTELSAPSRIGREISRLPAETLDKRD